MHCSENEINEVVSKGKQRIWQGVFGKPDIYYPITQCYLTALQHTPLPVNKKCFAVSLKIIPDLQDANVLQRHKSFKYQISYKI